MNIPPPLPQNDNTPSTPQPGKHRSSLVWILPVVGALVTAGVIGGWLLYRNHQNSILEEQTRRMQDSIERVQHAIEDSIQHARAMEAYEDSVRRNFTSPDLCFFELHGKVKTCTTNFITGFGHIDRNVTLEFDEKGVWINKSELPIPYSRGRITRNAAGYITKWEYSSESDDCFDKSYRWDGDQIVKEDGSGWEYFYEWNLTYDSNARLSSSTGQDGGEGIVGENRIKYTYSDFDDYGNWLKRSQKMSWDNYEDYVDRRYVDSGSQNFTDTRVITYYR